MMIDRKKRINEIATVDNTIRRGDNLIHDFTHDESGRILRKKERNNTLSRDGVNAKIRHPCRYSNLYAWMSG